MLCLCKFCAQLRKVWGRTKAAHAHQGKMHLLSAGMLIKTICVLSNRCFETETN